MEEIKTDSKKKTSLGNKLRLALIVSGLASFIHFSHNALFVDEYPNFPSQVSGISVFISWLAVAGVGAIGFWLVGRNKQLVGLILVAIFGSLGISGLAHYTIAPMSAHTFAMNSTIWLEAITGAISLILVIGLMIAHFQVANKRF